MYLTKEQIKIAQEKTYEKCREYNIPFPTIYLQDFDQTLSAFENKYKEGTQIEKEDLALFGEKTAGLLRFMTGVMREQAQKGERTKMPRPEEFVMAATDYLYLQCMEKLGCPNIPVAFNDNVKKVMTACARELHRNYVKFDFSKEKAFKEQRRIDADKLLAGKVGENLRDINEGRVNLSKIGRLIADYQALTERQKRHTGIWRFFHGKENEARNALIGEMRASLKKVLGPNVDIDKAIPAEVSRKLAFDRIDNNIEKAIYDRIEKMDLVYGVDKISDNSKSISSEELNKDGDLLRKHVDLKGNDFRLFGSGDEKEQQKSQPIEPKKKDDPSTEIEAKSNGFSLLG